MMSILLSSACFVIGCIVGIVLMALGQSEWNKHSQDQSWPPRKEK